MFMTSSDYIAQKLINTDDLFCSLPWEEIEINLRDRTISWCCYSRDISFPKDLTVDFFTNNPEHRSRKSAFLNKERHSACNGCWASEKTSGTSKRKVKSNTKIHDKIKANPELDYLRVIGLTFDNTCTQSCLYCSSKFSSIIAEERGEEKFLKHNNTDIDVLLDWLDVITKDRIEYLDLRILGGEPLASVEFFKFLHILEEKLADRKFRIHIVTNCGASDKLLHKIEKLIKNDKTNWLWSFGLSNEAMGSVAENIRFHLNWDVFDKNFNFFINQKVSYIILAMTPNVFSIKHLPLYIQYVYDHLTKVDVPFGFVNNWVTTPKELSPANLPIEFRKYVDEAIQIVLNSKGKHAEACKNNVHIWLKSLKSIIGTGSYTSSDIEEFLIKENNYKNKKLDVNLLLDQTKL